MNKNICNNCGRQGHMFYQCKLPISSYGIVLFHEFDGIRKFLMLRRKDSYGYIDFIRGKYSITNEFQIQSIIDEMSIHEKERIIKFSFNKLWTDMWLDSKNSHKNEEFNSEKKFYQITDKSNLININTFLDKSKTSWIETEWEFPKGRRNFNENDLECALREFEEETGINKENISIIENLLSFEEVFIGTNLKAYKHKYFLAYLNKNNSITNLDNYQISEVSKLEWKTYDECLESIRPYNLEKKKLITNINNVLEKYTLYS
jgi:8-oxo-dGTP pyrophosphatase MutT (NUDIX family)